MLTIPIAIHLARRPMFLLYFLASSPAILAAFGELDRPLSPGGRGHREFLYQQQGVTLAMRQEFRDRLLACDRDSIRRVATSYLGPERAQSAIGILAGEELLSGVPVNWKSSGRGSTSYRKIVSKNP